MESPEPRPEEASRAERDGPDRAHQGDQSGAQPTTATAEDVERSSQESSATAEIEAVQNTAAGAADAAQRVESASDDSSATPGATVERLRAAAQERQVAFTRLREEVAELCEEIKQIRDQPAALADELNNLRVELAAAKDHISSRTEMLAPQSWMTEEDEPGPESQQASGRRAGRFHLRKRP